MCVVQVTHHNYLVCMTEGRDDKLNGKYVV